MDTLRTVIRRTLGKTNKPFLSKQHPRTMTSFALFYDYVDGILEKRGPYRDEHLALARRYLDEGKLTHAGPFTPPTGAMFLFANVQKQNVVDFINDDVYVKNGLVTGHRIQEWNVVIQK